jgi:hypothetical protein
LTFRKFPKFSKNFRNRKSKLQNTENIENFEIEIEISNIPDANDVCCHAAKCAQVSLLCVAASFRCATLLGRVTVDAAVAGGLIDAARVIAEVNRALLKMICVCLFLYLIYI